MKVCSNVGPLAGQRSSVIPFIYTFGKPIFDYLQEDREYGQAFEDLMTARRGSTWQKWYDVFPVKDIVDPSEVGDVLLVDVAGGQGYWTHLFKQAHPQLPGRLIVQDQPHVLQKLDGIETMSYDFFEPQPVTDARFYHLKQIIHDWDDEKSTVILKNIAEAMKKGYSTLIVDDYVLPDEKVGLRAASMVNTLTRLRFLADLV
jgi:hypothetical protein